MMLKQSNLCRTNSLDAPQVSLHQCPNRRKLLRIKLEEFMPRSLKTVIWCYFCDGYICKGNIYFLENVS